eukprot:m.14898 g.14898  ORF g.14898 m.14898 type:complete len:56 (+) comp26034_c0_seq1:1897-2064(+)
MASRFSALCCCLVTMHELKMTEEVYKSTVFVDIVLNFNNGEVKCIILRLSSEKLY